MKNLNCSKKIPLPAKLNGWHVHSLRAFCLLVGAIDQGCLPKNLTGKLPQRFFSKDPKTLCSAGEGSHKQHVTKSYAVAGASPSK